MTPNRSLRTATLLSLMATSGLAMASPSSGWDWFVAPYGWFISVDSDIESQTPPVTVSNQSRFDDLFGELDGAFEVHAEGEGDDFGMFADFTYLGLARQDDRQFLHTDSDLDARLFEVAGLWSPGAERGRGAQVFGGARVIDLDYNTNFIPNNPIFAPHSIHIGETYVDLMIGARYRWALSERWSLIVSGDGSFGDTDGTWSASAVARYHTGNGAWLFGYRYLDANFEQDGDRLSLALYGPELGYAFRF